MKLLIITQVVNEQHPVLGFFIDWINEFARNSEKVTVICLEKGNCTLPNNVKVLSLGKEVGTSKIKQLVSFYSYILKRRHDYDAVFVHMNPLYVVLGGLFWRMTGKKIGLWYTHGTVTLILRIATFLTNRVFTASDESFRINTRKKQVVGHGIYGGRISIFEGQKDLDLLTIGRVSEAKNLHTLIDIVTPIAQSKGIKLHIVGPTVTEADELYKKRLEKMSQDKGIVNNIVFHGPMPYDELPPLRSRSKIFVTTAQNGSLDKAMLEAMASGMPVISMAPGSCSLPLGDDQVSSPEEFSNALLGVLESGNYERDDYVAYVKENHSLESLVKNILSVY